MIELYIKKQEFKYFRRNGGLSSWIFKKVINRFDRKASIFEGINLRF